VDERERMEVAKEWNGVVVDDLYLLSKDQAARVVEW
jgi:hypothetical protein